MQNPKALGVGICNNKMSFFFLITGTHIACRLLQVNWSGRCNSIQVYFRLDSRLLHTVRLGSDWLPGGEILFPTGASRYGEVFYLTPFIDFFPVPPSYGSRNGVCFEKGNAGLGCGSLWQIEYSISVVEVLP